MTHFIYGIQNVHSLFYFSFMQDNSLFFLFQNITSAFLDFATEELCINCHASQLRNSCKLGNMEKAEDCLWEQKVMQEQFFFLAYTTRTFFQGVLIVNEYQSTSHLTLYAIRHVSSVCISEHSNWSFESLPQMVYTIAYLKVKMAPNNLVTLANSYYTHSLYMYKHIMEL